MPTGCYIRTRKYRQEVSDRNKKLGIKPPSTLGLHWVLSEESKKKISDGHKGKKFSEEHKKRISEGIKRHLPRTAFKKGHEMPLEWRQKISKSSKGNKRCVGRIPWNRNLIGYKAGKEHWNWKGGRGKKYKHIDTQTFRYKEWRKMVFERDKYKCQMCGKTKCYLEPHHKKSWTYYPKLRYKVSNGIALCRDCHELTFKKNYSIYT